MITTVPVIKQCERRRCADAEHSLSHDHVSVRIRNARLISSSQACYNAATRHLLAKVTTEQGPMANHPLTVAGSRIATERVGTILPVESEISLQHV
jgi:hypothetical protein